MALCRYLVLRQAGVVVDGHGLQTGVGKLCRLRIMVDKVHSTRATAPDLPASRKLHQQHAMRRKFGEMKKMKKIEEEKIETRTSTKMF